MLKKYLTVALAFSVAVCVSAQKVVFDSVNVDVGTTLWKKPVTATFKFKNKERTPLRIEKVALRTCAGCRIWLLFRLYSPFWQFRVAGSQQKLVANLG